MHKLCIALFVLLCSPLGVSAGNVDVTADTPSGTYHAPIHIILTPTEPESKTFYSFKPDGYPTDAFLYTGAILLKHSSPFIYFSIIDPTNESKIKQNDYILEYPSTIRLAAEPVSGSGKMKVALMNSGSEGADIGFWQVQSESDAVVIPEGTVIAPWAKYEVYLNYWGTSSIVLRSPDDDEKDILIPQTGPGKNGVALPKKKGTVVKIVPRKILSTRETLPNAIPEMVSNLPEKAETPRGALPEWSIPAPVLSSPAAPSPQTGEPAPSVQIDTPVSHPSASDINQAVKVSANESGQKGVKPAYVVVLAALSVGIGGFRWMARRRQG